MQPRKASSAPSTPVRPSSAGPLRSSRSKSINVNKCHRMLSAYGVSIPVVDPASANKFEDNLIKISQQAEEELKKTVKQAHRSVPSSPAKSSILAWSDSYSLDSTNRIGYSNAYDYNYHKTSTGTTAAPFVIVDPDNPVSDHDAVKINAQLALRRMNAKNHIQRSSSDNAVHRGRKKSQEPPQASYILNNYQIQSFDNKDSDVNYVLFDDGVLLDEELVEVSGKHKKRAKGKRHHHRWVYNMEQSLLKTEEPSLASSKNPWNQRKGSKSKPMSAAQERSLSNTNSNIGSSDTLLDTIEFIVSDVFSIVFDQLLHDFLRIIIRNRPHSSPRGFRCGTFQIKKPAMPQRPSSASSQRGAKLQQQQNDAAAAAGQQVEAVPRSESPHPTSAGVGADMVGSPAKTNEEVRPRKYSDRLSYFVASHSVRSTMLVRGASGLGAGHAGSTNHTALANKNERAQVIDNFTFVNKDRQPLPHVKQLMYDLQLRINAHKDYSLPT